MAEARPAWEAKVRAAVRAAVEDIMPVVKQHTGSFGEGILASLLVAKILTESLGELRKDAPDFDFYLSELERLSVSIHKLSPTTVLVATTELRVEDEDESEDCHMDECPLHGSRNKPS